jgi:hypothetical protein
MTPGTVTLSLADVDKLRDDIKEGKRIEEELKKELADTKADKRIVKVTISSKNDIVAPPVSIDNFKLRSFVQDVVRDVANYSRYSSGISTSSIEIERYAYQLHKCVNVVYRASIETQEKIEYINLSDVEEEIKKKAELEVADELGQLRVSTRKAEEKLAEERAENYDKIAAIKKESEKQINGFKEEYYAERDELNKVINEWEKKYTDLKEDRNTRTEIQKLVDKIKELETSLETESAKKWYHKIL